MNQEDNDDLSYIRRGRLVREKYMLRPSEIDVVPYLRWIRAYDHNKHHYPIYTLVDEPEDFARVKRMLHHLFCQISDLLACDGIQFPSLTAA